MKYLPLVRRPFPPLPPPDPATIEHLQRKLAELFGGPVTVKGDPTHPLFPVVKLLETPK